MSPAEPAHAVDQFLQELSDQGIRLWADGERLRYDAPSGALTEALRERLARHKRDILARLSRREADGGARTFLLEDMQQAYWVGQSGALELGTVASYYMEADIERVSAHTLSKALRRLVERHELLRAVILPSGEQQVLERVPDYDLRVHDLVELAPAEQERRMSAVREAMCERELSTGTWPQFDVQASELGTGLRLHLRFALWMLDAWSLRVFMTELLRLCHDGDAALPPVGMSFGEYVSAQRASRRGARYEAAWNYWRPRLAAFPSAPSLPLAQSAHQVDRPRFRHLTHSLSRQTWERLSRRAASAGVTPSLLLCAAYAEVLARYSRSHHFALTVLHSHRTAYLPRAESVIGNFGTTLLLEVNLARQESFQARARTLQRQFWKDLEHTPVSGLEVSRELNKLRGNRGGVTVPITFTTAPSLEGDTGSSPFPVTVRHASSHLQVPQVYLDHQVIDGADGEANLNWDYVEQVFPRGFVEDAFGAYVRLVEHLARSDEAWHSPSPWPPDASALPRFPRVTEADLPAGPLLLQDAFARQARLRPEHPAVICPSRSLTYGELHRLSTRLGGRLRELGARPSTLVAVVMEKGWEQVVAVLGVLFSGAAYVPVDPELPESRRALLLEESGARLALTQSWLDTSLSWPEGVSRLCVDALQDTGAPPLELPAAQRPEDLAYVIFTSGSTGKPKGVMIDHLGAVNTVVDINDRLGVRTDDRVFAISSLSFDLSVYDIFGTLAAGATVVFPEARLAKEPFHWLEVIQRHGVTLWNSVPALMQLLVECAVARASTPSSLRQVMLSGDWIPLSLPTQLQALLPEAKVLSLGGATEASIWSILFPIDRVEPGWRSIPYGRAMLNQSVHVLDNALDECPLWVPGELYIGGIGVAKGYWGDERRSAERFISHPRTGDRIYRTGDLGRYLPTGDIEFLGREDFQVKIQGFRIECSEIEAALLKSPEVKAVAVSAVADPGGAKRLVAYVVPAGAQEEAALTAALQEHLRQSLPAYMVPSAFRVLPALPLSSNGKVDRKALPAPSVAATSARPTGFVAPRDGLEQQLAELWSDVLGVRPLGVRDDFFDLGGSSFAGMRLMARIHERFGRTLQLGTLVHNPTVERIAALLRDPAVEQGGSSPLVTIQAAGHRPPLFCVHPVGGNVLCYVELARNLGPGQPLYGLQAPGLLPGGEVLDSIEAMASRYIQALQAVQRRGPYHLGGWSLGGIVAYEMARQLREVGESVATVVMIDSHLPERRDVPARFDDAALLAAFGRDVSIMAGRLPPATAAELEALPAEQRFPAFVDRATRGGVLSGGVEELRRLCEVFKAHTSALHRYTPKPYPGEVLLFNASNRPEGAGLDGWRALSAHLSVQEVDADHYSIMTGARLKQVAEGIAARVSRSEAPAVEASQGVSLAGERHAGSR